MNLFRKLRDILNPPEKATPLGLDDHEIRALADLRASPEWDTYLRALDLQSTLYGEALLSGGSRDPAFLHEMRGHVLGLRMAGTLIDQLMIQEKERKELDERRRSEQSDDDRRYSLINTSAYHSR